MYGAGNSGVGPSLPAPKNAKPPAAPKLPPTPAAKGTASSSSTPSPALAAPVATPSVSVVTPSVTGPVLPPESKSAFVLFIPRTQHTSSSVLDACKTSVIGIDIPPCLQYLLEPVDPKAKLNLGLLKEAEEAITSIFEGNDVAFVSWAKLHQAFAMHFKATDLGVRALVYGTTAKLLVQKDDFYSNTFIMIAWKRGFWKKAKLEELDEKKGV